MYCKIKLLARKLVDSYLLERLFAIAIKEKLSYYLSLLYR